MKKYVVDVANKKIIPEEKFAKYVENKLYKTQDKEMLLFFSDYLQNVSDALEVFFMTSEEKGKLLIDFIEDLKINDSECFYVTQENEN